jgi:hypothetical protein
MVLTWIRHVLGLDDAGQHNAVLLDDFTNKAEHFYPDPETLWEPVVLTPTSSPSRVTYLLKNDPRRPMVVQRMVYLQRELAKLWTRLSATQANWDRRWREMDTLRGFFEPEDGVSRLAQKPMGGYDVRAYAHESWIFVELPTFASVETGTDGVNTTEAKRRTTLVHILVHELAHVAGHWKHDDKHSACVAWLKKYTV